MLCYIILYCGGLGLGFGASGSRQGSPSSRCRRERGGGMCPRERAGGMCPRDGGGKGREESGREGEGEREKVAGSCMPSHYTPCRDMPQSLTVASMAIFTIHTYTNN